MMQSFVKESFHTRSPLPEVLHALGVIWSLDAVIEVLQISGVMWALETVLSFAHTCMEGLQNRTTTACILHALMTLIQIAPSSTHAHTTCPTGGSHSACSGHTADIHRKHHQPPQVCLPDQHYNYTDLHTSLLGARTPLVPATIMGIVVSSAHTLCAHTLCAHIHTHTHAHIKRYSGLLS